MTEKPKGNILIVDDSPMIQMVGKKILTGKGFSVSVADNGQEGLKLFYSQHFDLVVLDYHMPKLNGLQFINAVRNSTDSAFSSYNVPIIMLSGESDAREINRLIEAGANDYIYKKSLTKTPEIFLEKIFGLLKFQEEMLRYKSMKLQRELSPYVLQFYRFSKKFAKQYIEISEITGTMLEELNAELDIINRAMEEGERIGLIFETPNEDEYLICHSVNSTLLAIFFCDFTLKWEWEKIRQVAAGAFLHDFGNLSKELMFTRVPSQMDDDEFKRYVTHVERGVALAEKVGLGDVALEYIRNHHERADGSGYPAHRKEAEMSDLGKMASIIDTFDCLTFSRGVNKRIMVGEALRKMKSWEGQYSEEHLRKFEELTHQIALKPDIA